MQNINFATASVQELEAAGYTVTTKKSQAVTRRTKKSAWGARPSINRANHGSAKTISNADQNSTGNIRRWCHVNALLSLWLLVTYSRSFYYAKPN